MKIRVYYKEKYYDFTPKSTKIKNLHMGYGTKEPKRLEAESAELYFDMNDEQLDLLIHLMSLSADSIELFVTRKNSLLAKTEIILNTEANREEELTKVTLRLL